MRPCFATQNNRGGTNVAQVEAGCANIPAGAHCVRGAQLYLGQLNVVMPIGRHFKDREHELCEALVLRCAFLVVLVKKHEPVTSVALSPPSKQKKLLPTWNRGSSWPTTVRAPLLKIACRLPYSSSTRRARFARAAISTRARAYPWRYTPGRIQGWNAPRGWKVKDHKDLAH